MIRRIISLFWIFLLLLPASVGYAALHKYPEKPLVGCNFNGINEWVTGVVLTTD